MAIADLSGTRLRVIVSEPWEFVTAHGAGPFRGTILQTGPNEWSPGTEAILLQLKGPLIYEGVTCEYFIACPRVEGENVNALAVGQEIHCALTRIPSERANSPNPFDLSRWRGGVALVATLRAASVD